MSTDWQARVQALQRQIDALEPATSPAARAQLADLMLDKAEAFYRLGQREDEHETLLQIVDRFENDADADVRVSFCSALRNLAINYSTPDSSSEAALYHGRLRVFAEHPDERVRCQVIRGMLTNATFLENQGRHHDEMIEYDAIIDLFVDDPAPVVREHLAGAMFARALALDRCGDEPQGNAAYHELIEALRADHDNDTIAWCVCKAHVNLLFNCLRESQFKQARHHGRATLVLAGERPHAGLQDQVGRALIGIARLHDAVGDHDGEQKALDELIQRLGDSPHLVAKAFVADALNRKGRGLVVDFNDRVKAIDCYQRVIDRFGETPLAPPDGATAADHDHHRTLIRQLARASYNAAQAYSELLNFDQARFWIHQLEVNYGPYDDPQVIETLSSAHDLSLTIEKKSSRTNPLKALFDRSAPPGGRPAGDDSQASTDRPR